MNPNQPNDPLIGRLVDGRYRVRARIARGGMATVYVATDLRLERRIALKVMHAHLSDDTVFQGRFIQEARAAARLADPHVVNVFDQGQDGELAYLVMEYLPGITLRELLKEQRRLTVAQTVTVMDAVLSGLSAAHRAGIVHRDVKPENVLLAEDGRIKIGDFGLARATTANTATGQQLMGTIAYLAPELVTRGTADARSDIYALGIMLYEMLVGEQPYRGEQPMQIAFQHATESVPRPSAKNPSVPDGLDELVLWSTAREPDDRPLDAQVMLDRLREIEREIGVTPAVTDHEPLTNQTVILDEYDTGGQTSVMPAPTTTATPVTPRVDSPDDNATRLRRVTTRRKRRGGIIAVVTIVLALIAGVLGWYFGSGPGSQIQVPTVAGSTYEQAVADLGAVNFTATREDQPSMTVPAGTVIDSDPAAGSRVNKESTIKLIVSTGPQQYDIPQYAGFTEQQAIDELKKMNIDTIDDNKIYEYSSTVPAGELIWLSIIPASGAETYNCWEGGCQAFAGDKAKMYISLGAVTDVTGWSLSDAVAELTKQDFEIDEQHQYSDDVAAGLVISMSGPADGSTYRPGDTITIVISDGRQPITVPSVKGLTMREAIDKLKGLGLDAKTTLPDTTLPQVGSVWDVYKAGSTDPASGSTAYKGDEVWVTIVI